jgi:hypothetical protein
MPLVTLAPMALEIYHRDLPNRVTTSFTLMRNSADSRRLAQCRDTVSCTLSHAGHEPLPNAGAQWTLEAVGSMSW